MSNTMPTIETVLERMAELREEQRQFRDFVESKFAEMAAENKRDFKSVSRKLEILNDDILKVRESIRDLEERIDQIQPDPNAPTADLR